MKRIIYTPKPQPLSKEKFLCDLEELINDGIIDPTDIAHYFGMSLEKIRELHDPEFTDTINRLTVEHKRMLNRKMREYSESGSRRDKYAMASTKYLLESLHNQYVAKTLKQAMYKENKRRNRFKQTLAAAKYSTAWDEATTTKFIETVQMLDKVIEEEEKEKGL